MTIIDKLGNFSLFSLLSKSSQDLVNEHALWKSYQAKEHLIEKGDSVAGVFLIQSGSLRVYTINSKGHETTLYWVNSGNSCVLAMNCIFSNLFYPAWVESCEEEVEIAIIPPAIYRKLFETEPLIQEFTFNVQSATVFDLLTTLEEAVTSSFMQRLASLLIKKADNRKIVNLGHDEIANHLGTAREVVSRACRQMQNKGLISTKRKEITLLDTTALSKLTLE